MESQESQLEENIFSLLAEANQWADVEKARNASNLIDAVISFLRSAPPAEEGVQATRMAFGSVVPHLPVDKTAFNFFDTAFSFLKSFYDTFLQGCNGKDPTAISHVANLLQQCCTVSECCELTVQFLLQAEKIAVEDLGDVPQVFLHIVTSSLAHCQQSEAVYADQLHQIQESLARLFQLSVEVATNFASLLSRLTFDLLEEDDLVILTDVCNKLCTTAAYLSQLSEVRGSVTVWRAYTSLIQQYHGALITRLDLSPPMTALVKEIKDGLLTLASLKNNIVEGKERKIVQRIIKMTSFCLKVVIALCEKFHGYLMGCHVTLVLLILLLFRFSPKNVMLSDYPEDVKKDLELQVTIGIEPLLMHLRNDEDFIEVVKESVQKEESVVDDWGCHILLLTAVLFPLRSCISHHMNSIVSIIFQATEKGHASLSFPCMMDGIMFGGKPLSAVTLYEHTVMRVCAAVATFDSQQFELLERDLVHWLLCGQTWSSFLAADVWCFIARYGTSDLCRTHCIFLLEILSQTQNAPTSIQHLLTVALLSRLMGKLSPSHKEDIISRLNAARQNDTGGGTWLKLVHNGTEERLKAQSYLEDFIELMNIITSRTASGEDIIKLMDGLQDTELQLEAFIRSAEDPILINFISPLVLLWTRVPVNYIRCSLVDKLICGLLRISALLLNHLSSSELLQVLYPVKECCLKGSVTLRISMCDFVTTLGCCHLPESPDLHAILSIMSDMLSDMMKDSNPLVHQYAIDAFVAVGKHTAHEEVLPMCLEGCEAEVREQVTLYLQQTSHPTHQCILALLQYQSVRMQQRVTLKIQNDAVLIAHHLLPESQQTSIVHQQGHEEVLVAKRRRESLSFNEEIPDMSMLLNSLNNSHSLLKKIKEKYVFVNDEDNRKVKSILNSMLNVWDTNESAYMGSDTA